MFLNHAFLFIASITFKTKSNQYLSICGTFHSPLHLTGIYLLVIQTLDDKGKEEVACINIQMAGNIN